MSASTTTSPGKLPPGPRGLPLFGSLLDVRHDTHLAIDRLARRYGNVCLLRFGSVPTVIVNDPDLLQEAFGKTELADRWVSEIMDILSQQKDLVMAPYGEHWRQMQRFANRELLSARNLENVREHYIEGVVNDLVEQMGRGGDAGETVSPTELTARSNSTLMFRSIFGHEEEAGGEFLDLREALLEHVKWIFANATATNLADYIPWLRFLPNGGVREARRQSEIGTAIITALVEGARNRAGLDLSAPACLVEVMLAREEAGEITNDMIQDLCMDLLIAGTDTSAQTVNWTLLLLANRPKIQAKVREELDRVIGPDAPAHGGRPHPASLHLRLPGRVHALPHHRPPGAAAQSLAGHGDRRVPDSGRSAGAGQHLLHPPRRKSMGLAPRIRPGAVPAPGRRLAVTGPDRKRLHPLRHGPPALPGPTLC